MTYPFIEKYQYQNMQYHTPLLHKAIYNKINQERQRVIERWSTLTLDLISQIQIIKMNVLRFCIGSCIYQLSLHSLNSWAKTASSDEGPS